MLVHLGRTPEWHGVVLGALSAGLVVVPCRADSDAHDLALFGELSDARIVVTARARVGAFAKVDVPVEILVVEEVAAELLALNPLQPYYDTIADDLAFLVYPPDPADDPLGDAYTQGSASAALAISIQSLGIETDDLLWCSGPIGAADWLWSHLLGPVGVRAGVVVHDATFDPEERIDLVQRLNVSVLCQTPAELEALAQLHGGRALGRVRRVVSTGAPLEPHVVEAFRDAFGLEIYDRSGQEASATAMGVPTNVR